MKRAAFLCVTALVLITSVARADFEDGVKAARQGDYATALKEWKLLAEQGHASAQYNLGVMYANGQGVPQDYAEAMKWYRKAAEQGNAGAQNNLGVMYANGQGVPQDYIQAHMWWNLSAAQGNKVAVQNRDLIASKMSPEQVAQAQRLAREWKPKN